MIAVLPNIYVINVLDVDLYLCSFKIMSSWVDTKLYNPEKYANGSVYTLQFIWIIQDIALETLITDISFG